MTNKVLLKIFIALFIIFIIALLVLIKYKITVKESNIQQTAAMQINLQKNIEGSVRKNNNDEDAIVVVLNDNYKEKEVKQEELKVKDKNENTEEKQNENNIQNEDKNNKKTSVLNDNTNYNYSDNSFTVNPYYIKVNYSSNVVTIYVADKNGNYTIPCRACTCSTGTATPTSGKYKMDYKYRWLGLFGGVYGQYCTRIVGNILFHSVPYLENGNAGSLEYWEYDKLRRNCIYGMYKAKRRRC